MRNFSDRQIIAIMLAASFASTIGGLPFNALPILLGTLADTFHLSPQQAGLLGSSCFAGYLAGTLAAALFIDRLNWRRLTLGCALGAATALLVSSRLPIEGQYPIWAAVGFFAALMTCLGMRIIGELPNKERALGVRQGIELSTTAAVLFALPPLFIAPYGYPGAATALAGIILLLSLSALRLPNHGDMPSASQRPARRNIRRRCWPTRPSSSCSSFSPARSACGPFSNASATPSRLRPPNWERCLRCSSCSAAPPPWVPPPSAAASVSVRRICWHSA